MTFLEDKDGGVGSLEFGKFLANTLGLTAVNTYSEVWGAPLDDIITALEILTDRVEEQDGGYYTLVGKSSGGDFITSYSDGTSFDCDSMPVGHPVLIDEDIESIKQINAAGNVVEIYVRNETPMVVSNPVGSTYRIKIAAATFGTTDTFVVYTNISQTVYATKTLGLDTYAEAVTRGIVVAGVRKDAPGTLVDTTNEFTTFQFNNLGNSRMDLASIVDTAIDVNSGNKSAGTQRLTIATDDINMAAINAVSGIITDVALVAGTTGTISSKLRTLSRDIGPVDGVAVSGDNSGDLSAKLRGINKILGTIGDVADANGTQAGQLFYLNTELDEINAVLGLPTDIAVSGDSAGTIDAQLRGLNKRLGSIADAPLIDGSEAAQLEYIGSFVDNIPSLGTTTMPTSAPITVATDDTQFGAVGAASDVDGNVHGQLRYIGETIDTSLTTPTALGIKTNAAVGTSSEQLTADSVTCKYAIVTAHPDNTGRITVGASGVTDGNGIVLYAADSIPIRIDNVNKIYVISSVDGEDVSVTYFN